MSDDDVQLGGPVGHYMGETYELERLRALLAFANGYDGLKRGLLDMRPSSIGYRVIVCTGAEDEPEVMAGMMRAGLSLIALVAQRFVEMAYADDAEVAEALWGAAATEVEQWLEAQREAEKAEEGEGEE